jgi:hypothetical protein
MSPPFSTFPYPEAPRPHMTNAEYRRQDGRRCIWVGVVPLLLSVVGILHTYGVVGSANGGITVSVPGFNGGLELWGSPGFFGCRDTGC